MLVVAGVWSVDVRQRRVGIQIDALKVEDVVLGVLAVLQRVVARDVEGVVEGRDVGRAAKQARPRRGGGGEEGGREDKVELHAGFPCAVVILEWMSVFVGRLLKAEEEWVEVEVYPGVAAQRKGR